MSGPAGGVNDTAGAGADGVGGGAEEAVAEELDEAVAEELEEAERELEEGCGGRGLEGAEEASVRPHPKASEETEASQARLLIDV